jgi:uroporphyrinogen III methyltransferase/synthase
VYLVGAGPGDPGLMTARALDLIAGADAILYDRLIPDGALDGARADADLRYVGKQAGGRFMAQEETNALLVELGRAGRSVVRLKGGDPFVFGRGGEEAQALVEAGIEYEVVPGITAGVAAPAYAGIPVTHRDDASAVAFVTGHEDLEKAESALDWEALARFPGTLVLYMGVARLARIADRLVAAGRPPDHPVAVVERGTLPAQRTVVGTLRDIAERAEEAEIRPPAVTVVGPVAGLHRTLDWLARRPLSGRRVAVTRARAQASGLAVRLRDLGAEVLEAPAIRVTPRPVTGEVRRACQTISEYDLVCLTSPNGAVLLLDALAATGRDARALAGVAVAAIGPATARELTARGVTPDLVPGRAVAEEFVAALSGMRLDGRRVLVARAAEARDVLPDALRERGADLDVVALYDTLPEHLTKDELAALARADYVTFTSSSTVRNLMAAVDGRLPSTARVVTIGPVTSRTAREHGLEVHAEAERHDVEGLVQALLDDAGVGAS